MKKVFRYSVTGFLLGLGFSAAIFLYFWLRTMEFEYRLKVSLYERFLFWQKSKKEGKSDLQGATEMYRVIHNQPDFQAQDHQYVKSGHPEYFIKTTFGYDLWDGFGYGKKPGRLETFFELHTIGDTFSKMAGIMSLPYIAIVMCPFIGGVAGFILGRRQAAYL
ncbi:MAG: hypothetical protein MUO33_04040 [Sedimentisphaerales bacterium]|jgi:hypothetical protein|nr:hypothetical protein [Sedimentisphaerales bacterium]